MEIQVQIAFFTFLNEDASSNCISAMNFLLCSYLFSWVLLIMFYFLVFILFNPSLLKMEASLTFGGIVIGISIHGIEVRHLDLNLLFLIVL